MPLPDTAQPGYCVFLSLVSCCKDAELLRCRDMESTTNPLPIFSLTILSLMSMHQKPLNPYTWASTKTFMSNNIPPQRINTTPWLMALHVKFMWRRLTPEAKA